MTSVSANGVTIEYEAFGPPEAPAILLVMGLGMQLVAWPDSLCEGLAGRGFRVVRFDNRDVGLSSRMPSRGRLATTATLARALVRLPVRPPYTLDDMARDAAGLMDALRIGAAHVVGASMGGMIAQILAVEHPERVKSLTSIMSAPSRVLAAAESSARASAANAARPGGRDPAHERLLPSRRRLAISADRRGARSEGRPVGQPQLSPRRLRPPAHRDRGRAEPRADARPRQGADARPARLRRSARAADRRHDDRRRDPRRPLAHRSGMGHFLPEALVPLLVDEIAAHCRNADGADPA